MGSPIETAWTEAFERELKRRYGTGPRKLARQNDFDEEILAACKAWSGADPLIVKSMIAQESSFIPTARNSLGFAGLTQLGMEEAKSGGLSTGRSTPQTEEHRHKRTAYPDSGYDLEGDERFKPAKSTLGAVRLLERKAESLEKRVFATYGTPTGDDLHRFILAAYFAGQGSVEKAVKRTYPEGRPAALRFDDLKGQLTVYANAIVARARQGQPATDEDDDTPAAAAPDAASLLALFEPVVKVFTSAHSFLTSLGDEDGLRSTTLGSVERLVRLVAEDEAGAAIARDDPDEEAVAALQRALALAGYDLGTFGPARDGIDGDFGGTTEEVVKRFQKEKLAGIVAAHPERFEGTSAAEAAPGKVDRVTLLALDLLVDPLEDGPDDDVPLPAPAALVTPVATPSTPAAPLGAEVTFDAASQRTSMQFGLRMYQAMLRWQWKRQADGRYEGVGFSTTVATDYGTYLPKGYRPEWPDLTGLVTPDEVSEVGGRKLPVYKFGVSWKGTNFTNCTNSQCAALYVAAGAKGFSVRGADGQVTRYPFAGPDPKWTVRTSKTGKARPQPVMKIFQQTFVAATHFYSEAGQDLWIKRAEGSVSAIVAMGIGAMINTRTAEPERMRDLRIGDAANGPSHAFMIGDVRYGIWLEGHTKGPDYILDQSAFVDADPTPVPTQGKAALRVAGRAPLTHAEADWIIGHEEVFEARLQAFLSATQLTLGGASRAVRIQPVGFRMFSANGSKKTVHGAVRGTTTPVSHYGITQPWADFDKTLAWARFYRLA